MMGKESIQTAVMGVSGYAGLELARLLLHHPALQGAAPDLSRAGRGCRSLDRHASSAGR